MAADLWDQVVGIPLTDWMRADTVEQVRWLTWLRDHPMPEPPPRDTVDVFDFAGCKIHTIRLR